MFSVRFRPAAQAPRRLGRARRPCDRSPTSQLSSESEETGCRPLRVSHLPHLGCLSYSGYAWPRPATPCPPVPPCMRRRLPWKSRAQFATTRAMRRNTPQTHGDISTSYRQPGTVPQRTSRLRGSRMRAETILAVAPGAYSFPKMVAALPGTPRASVSEPVTAWRRLAFRVRFRGDRRSAGRASWPRLHSSPALSWPEAGKGDYMPRSKSGVFCFGSVAFSCSDWRETFVWRSPPRLSP